MTETPHKLWLRILSDPANLASVRQAVESLCARGGIHKCVCDEVGLCVNEALANVIRHAYAGATDRPIELSVEVVDAQVRIRIRDWGSGVIPIEPAAASRQRDPLKPGGLGLVCLRRMMDSVRFTPQPDGGMLLEMTRSARASASEANTQRPQAANEPELPGLS
ncbi:ATP-binding protein [Fontivita pretiosa]|uniref:ATP-binding protein n=1 Tax=Fontivita pretiosa TaxID=2989684 RepID=UPI003D173F17